MRMIPSRVVRAHAEWILPPTKYRLSKTLAGSAYQVSRAGALAGFATYAGTTSLASSPPLWGRRQTRTSVPRNSNPAAVLADCTAAWASASKSRLACANAPPATSAESTAKLAEMPADRFMMGSLVYLAERDIQSRSSPHGWTFDEPSDRPKRARRTRARGRPELRTAHASNAHAGHRAGRGLRGRVALGPERALARMDGRGAERARVAAHRARARAPERQSLPCRAAQSGFRFRERRRLDSGDRFQSRAEHRDVRDVGHGQGRHRRVALPRALPGGAACSCGRRADGARLRAASPAVLRNRKACEPAAPGRLSDHDRSGDVPARAPRAAAESDARRAVQHRRAVGAAQPHPLGVGGRERVPALPAYRPSVVGGDDGHRPLQGDQRSPRPSSPPTTD